jgi:uncharacterized protein YjbI with pentapeptide repeats
VFPVFFFVTLRQGLGAGLRSVAMAAVLAAALAAALAVALTATGPGMLTEALTGRGALGGALGGAGAWAGTLAGILAVAWALAVAEILAGAVAGILAGILAGAVAVAGAWAGVGTVVVAVAVAWAVATTLLGVYVARRTLAGDEQFALIRMLAVAFASTRGTSFRGADLTDADFTSATLKNTDFIGANLTRTCWKNAKLLDCACLGMTYLEKPQVRNLVVTLEGKETIFDNQDLQRINLHAAELTNARFIGADFYQARLQKADLSGAILVRTQLERADLTGACLTGACIQDWSVTRSTKLDGVLCKYVYMKFENGDKREPMPPKGEFKDGDFITFVKSILDTLDLYHERDVNPTVAVIILKSLSEEYQEPLQVVGLEKRGNGIILKLKTSEWVNQEQLKEEYYARYSQTLALSMQDPNKILPQYEVVETIPVLSKITEAVEEFKKHPTTSIENLSNDGLFVTGNFYMHHNSGISQNVTNSTVNGGVQAANKVNHNQQTIKTHVAASTEKQLNQAEVVELLAQIEQLIRGAELPEADKEKSLMYLLAAKAAAQEKEPKKQLTASNLESMAETLENASKTVATGKSLWENVEPILMQLPG